MLKYQTILESEKFKVSKVKNTTTKKSWYSFIYRSRFYDMTENDQVYEYFGEPYKILYSGREWKFKSLEQAIKKYHWAIMRWA